MEKVRIGVIGSSGQLGSQLLKDATARGYPVKGYTRQTLDITGYDSIERAVSADKPDLIFNCSVYHPAGSCELHPLRSYNVNTLGAAYTARICKARGIRLVTFSTDYVFDGTKLSPYTESDEPGPIQFYGLSKLSAELAVAGYYPDSMIVRTAGLYGGVAGSRIKRGNFILNLLKSVKANQLVRVSSDCISSHTYARHLSRTVMDIATGKYRPGLYHIVNTGYCSWRDFAAYILKLLGKSELFRTGKNRQSDDRVPRPRFSALTSNKLVLEKYMPPWQTGVREYLTELGYNTV